MRHRPWSAGRCGPSGRGRQPRRGHLVDSAHGADRAHGADESSDGSRGGRVHAVAAGDTVTAGSFTATVHGHRHALIHADLPCPDNVGYLLDDGALHHPGDAYFAPGAPVRTLLLPASGPWTKLGEAADCVRAVEPGRVIQIHELMLSDLGRHSTATILGEKGLTGTPIDRLAPGTTVQL